MLHALLKPPHVRGLLGMWVALASSSCGGGNGSATQDGTDAGGSSGGDLSACGDMSTSPWSLDGCLKQLAARCQNATSQVDCDRESWWFGGVEVEFGCTWSGGVLVTDTATCAEEPHDPACVLTVVPGDILCSDACLDTGDRNHFFVIDHAVFRPPCGPEGEVADIADPAVADCNGDNQPPECVCAVDLLCPP